MPSRITVELGERSYPVEIGPDILGGIAEQVRANAGSGRVFVFYDAQLFALHGERIREKLSKSEAVIEELTLPQGERTKSQANLNRIHTFLLARKISRSDLVIACGGGVISDLVGFAAATVLRGVPWGIVTTTLLGMVDAAIGGKTGINHRRGKNLIGAFWQPRFVLCDTGLLTTLPPRQMVAGVGEIIKYVGLSGQEMHRSVESYIEKGDLYDQDALTTLIERSAACKAGIVARDEKEGDVRRHLNLGHTFAHGIEFARGYRGLLHGEAVIVGLLAAVELSLLSGVATERDIGSYRELITKSLTWLPKRRIREERVLEGMELDKKREGTTQNFVLLQRPGHPLIVASPGADAVRSALAQALEAYDLHGGRNAPRPYRQRT